jgi:hypothetical protein
MIGRAERSLDDVDGEQARQRGAIRCTGSDARAFVFGQKGLMGDLSLQGSKIAKLER